MLGRRGARRGRVVGAEVIRDGRRETLTADTYVLACGTFGSPGLLLRRRWVVPVLLLLLLAIVVQFSSYYLLTPTWVLTGSAASALPLSVALAGLFLWWYARRAAARGWLLARSRHFGADPVAAGSAFNKAEIEAAAAAAGVGKFD